MRVDDVVDGEAYKVAEIIRRPDCYLPSPLLNKGTQNERDSVDDGFTGCTRRSAGLQQRGSSAGLEWGASIVRRENKGVCQVTAEDQRFYWRQRAKLSLWRAGSKAARYLFVH